ncbi:MAG: S8 family serine peptidase, partial [Armatimonadetes bacterium]|nr:S8 family serine peptidase [Armatimonadota bacterium]
DSGRTTTALLLLVVLFLLGSTVPLWGAEQQLNTVPIPGPPHAVTTANGTVRMMPARAVADRLIIKLRPHVGPQQVGTLAAAGNSRVRKVLPVSGLVIIDLPSGSDLMAAARQFESRPEVEFAVPDTLVYPALIPNDPEYSKQWHLPKIDAPLAWDVTTGTDTVTIAVVDSGCDMDHPDLASKIWTNPGEIPGNEVDDDGNGYVDDVHGYDFCNDDGDPTPQPTGGIDENVSHGTLVAGTAAAVGNEGWGAVGIDWQAKIMVLQVFPASGSGTVSSVVEATDYATANGADIINLSIGGGYSAAFSPPINTAYESGKLVICAAGNNSTKLTDSNRRSPVCNDGPNPLTDNYVLGVTATDSQDRKASFANWDGSTANFVDVAAPGQNIYGPAFYYPSDPQFDEYWYTNNGTSFSAPIASGLAALLIAQNPGLRGNPAAVYQMIRDTTDNIDPQNPGYAGMLGTGRVNAARALGLLLPPTAVTNLQAADTTGDQGGSITLTWLKSADDGGGGNNVTGYIVRRRTGASGPFSDIDSLPPGSQQYDDTPVTDGVDYYYIIRTVADTLYTDSEIAGPAQSLNDLAPPQITTLTARDRPSDSGGAIELEWTYSPPADFDFYSLYRSNRNFNTVEGRTPLITFTSPTTSAWTDTSVVDGADYYYAITATDGVGNENQLVQTAGPVQSYPNDEMPFDAGLQLLSAPAIPPDQHPATLFDIPSGDLIDRYARYDRVEGEYVIYTGDPLPPILQLDLARGFWVDLPYPVTVTPEGTSAPSGDFDVPLQPGWHLLGNPFFGPTDFGAATVFQDGTYDMLSAHRLGILCAVAWIYDVEDHSYKMISADSIGQR